MRTAVPTAPVRRHRVTIACAAVLAVVLTACAGARATPADAAAVVNGERISAAEFELMVRTQIDAPQGPLAGLEGAERTSRIVELQRQVLTQLIRLELVDQVAQERGIEVTEQDIDDRWEQEVAFQGDEQALLDLIDSLGLTVEQAREQLGAQVKQEKLRASIAADIEVQDQEVRELFESRADQYEQAAVSHILVETEAEANAILDLLEDGGSFEELAAARSTDPGSAEQGGSLGRAPRGQYVPEFDEAVWNAEEGEIVGPVETQFGFHVIRVEEFVTRSFEDVEESLRDELRNQRVDQAFRELVASLFADADVSIDSRFGEWDPATGQVVQADPLAPRSDPLSTEPAP